MSNSAFIHFRLIPLALNPSEKKLYEKFESIPEGLWSESEYTDFVKHVAQKGINVNAAVRAIREKIGDVDFIVGISDLFCFDVVSRKDAPYNDCFNPTLLESLNNNGNNFLFPDELKIVTSYYETINDVLRNSLAVENLKAAKNIFATSDSKIKLIKKLEGYEFLFPQYNLDYRQFRLNPSSPSIFVKNVDSCPVVNLDYLKQKNFEEMKAEIITVFEQAIFRCSEKKILLAPFSAKSRELLYRQIGDSYSSAKRIKLSNAIQRIIVFQSQSTMKNEQGTMAQYTFEKIYKPLKSFWDGLRKLQQNFRLDNAKVIPLLGDGELFVAIAGHEHSINLRYISRKTMMTDDEYHWYVQSIKNNPNAEVSGKLLDQSNVYSKLYRKEKNEISGIYVLATKAAETFKLDLISTMLGMEIPLIESRTGKTKRKNETTKYWNNLDDVGQEIINMQVQQNFLINFREGVQKAINTDVVFASKTKEIYDNQLACLVQANNPIIFIDSGIKGTIPALLCALTDIYNPEKNYNEPGYVSPAFMYILAAQADYADFVPHSSIGRLICKQVEYGGRLGKLKEDSSLLPLKIENSNTKDTILGIIAFENIRNFLRHRL